MPDRAETAVGHQDRPSSPSKKVRTSFITADITGHLLHIGRCPFSLQAHRSVLYVYFMLFYKIQVVLLVQ